jgi:transcriptional regulator with XRE-family HTH domain
MDAQSRFPKFAARLAKACDDHPDCPPLHKGRQIWIQKRLVEDGLSVSVEGIRKWLSGDMRPRQEKAEILAKVLGVDATWLILGKGSSAASSPGKIQAPTCSTLQIAIRPRVIVEIRGLPFDLTKAEADRVANIVLAHAEEEKQ